MGLEENSGGIPATMLVSPTGIGGGAPYPVYMGQGGNSGSNGNGWDNGWWIILLFILLASGNWGGNNNGNGGGMFGGAPIVVNDGGGSAVQRGFDQAAVMSGITGVQSGVQNLSTQLCNCCADVQSSLCNGFAGVNATVNSVAANAETAANARAMANMQQLFGLSTQFADCCCENRLSTADLKYTIATEECATRSADAMNTRDIIDSQTNGTRAILDKLCQLELDNYKAQIDAKNDTIAQLRAESIYTRGQASQDVQTARILAGQTAEVDALYNRLSQCPIPSEPVYGRQAIFTCPNNNNGCGCGCGNNGF